MIERMEDLVLNGINIPLTPLSIINADKLVPLMDRIRESLPEEVAMAHQILSCKETLLQEAQVKAHQLLQEAEQKAQWMLSESQLLKAVQQEAAIIREQLMGEIEALQKKAIEEAEFIKTHATEESRAIREETDQYADTILSSLDKSLSEVHSCIKEGQTNVQRSRATVARAEMNRHREPRVTKQPTIAVKKVPPSVSSSPSRPLEEQGKEELMVDDFTDLVQQSGLAPASNGGAGNSNGRASQAEILDRLGQRPSSNKKR
jgi:hypothetical protein